MCATPPPIRTCVGCGAKKPQRDMVRIASFEGQPPVLDLKYRAAGRGAYLCRNVSCVERAWTRHALERSLKLKQSVSGVLKQEVLQALNPGE